MRILQHHRPAVIDLDIADGSELRRQWLRELLAFGFGIGPQCFNRRCPRICGRLECFVKVRYGRIEMLLISSECSQSRSEEHTSELQSRENLVCRLLL